MAGKEVWRNHLEVSGEESFPSLIWCGSESSETTRDTCGHGHRCEKPVCTGLFADKLLWATAGIALPFLEPQLL